MKGCLKYIGFGIVGLLLVSVAAVFIGSDSGSSSDDFEPVPTFTSTPSADNNKTITDVEAPSPVVTNTPMPTDTPVPVPDPLVFTGVGPDVSPDFDVAGSVVFFQTRHEGSSNFAVWLKDAASGENVELLANEIGVYENSLAVGVEAGMYYFEVDADGQWSITAKLPPHIEKLSDADTYEMIGQGALHTGVFNLPGGRRFIDMSHDGDGNFAVWLYCLDSGRRELLANEIGPYNSTVTIAAQDCSYVLSVEADGNWQIDISK